MSQFPFPFSHLVVNCQTELKMKEFNYIWSITDFTKVYQLATRLDCKKVENQPFDFHIKINDNKLKLYAEKFSDNKNSPNLQTTEDSIKTLCSISPKVSEQLSDTHYVINNLSKSLFGCDICSVTLLHEINISDILSNTYTFLSQDTFTINFKFYFLDDILMRTMSRNILLKELPINMSDLSFDDKSNVTITFIVEDKFLYANKVLLCLKSAVFKAMFNSNLEENIKNEVEITDTEYDILKDFLLFIQFGTIPSLSFAKIETICKFFMVADKYDVQDLKLICEYYLKEKVTISDIETVFKFAHKYHMEDLKKYLGDFIMFHFKQIESIKWWNNETLIETLIKTNSEVLTELLPEMIKPKKPKAT